jgi:ABC-type Zn uptake system ZnuABC Zn-binding protein ZnuA
MNIRTSALLVAALCAPPVGAASARPLQVVASVPDLASLLREVGGDQVEVTQIIRGPQDPHAIEPRPSFIRSLHDADLFVVTGMDLEIGWAPVLLQSARNSRIQPGSSGYLDASQVIEPLEVPPPGASRAQGDLHPYGNPHYLTDPLNGLRVAGLIRDKLSELRPDQASLFRQRHDAFARTLMERLVGPDLAGRHDPAELARAIESESLDRFLEERGEASRLGGWLGAVRPLRGTKTAEEHQLWVYFARRFGLVLVVRLEPFPGIAPTTRHLGTVVETMRAQQVPFILTSAYFDPRHARWVAERSGARIVPLAHQSGARPGAEDGYLAATAYNVQTLVDSMGASGAAARGAQR